MKGPCVRSPRSPPTTPAAWNCSIASIAVFIADRPSDRSTVSKYLTEFARPKNHLLVTEANARRRNSSSAERAILERANASVAREEQLEKSKPVDILEGVRSQRP